MTDKQKSILKTYFEVLNKTKKIPTKTTLNQAGVSYDAIRRAFGNPTELYNAAMKSNPALVERIAGHDVYTNTNTLNVADYKRYVITTAVAGADLESKFYQNIKNYCKLNKAKLLILPIEDPAQVNSLRVDNSLKDEFFVLQDLRLNSNLFISTIKISAKQINPLTGLRRISQRQGCTVYASPKQFMESVAASNSKIPSVLMTTGAITKANYETDSYMSKRTAYLAVNDHKIGALIVEIENDRYFYFRQIQALPDGSFTDLCKKYSGSKVTTNVPEAFIMGDLHSGQTDDAVLGNWLECIKYTSAKTTVLHDMFNGLSINPHERKRHSTLAAHADKLNLVNEILECSNNLKRILSGGAKEIVITKSNHDLFLDRWLESGDYINDPQNLPVALLLANAQIKGVDPLKFAIQYYGGLTKAEFAKLRFLSEDDDYIVAGCQLAAHGHAGQNGSKGSVPGIERAYGNAFTGHTHSPCIFRDIWVVGTTSHLRLGYNKGASTWGNASGLLYGDGTKQMVFSINGKWRLDSCK